MAFVPLVPIGDPLTKLVDERTADEPRAALGALDHTRSIANCYLEIAPRTAKRDA